VNDLFDSAALKIVSFLVQIRVQNVGFVDVVVAVVVVAVVEAVFPKEAVLLVQVAIC